MHAQLLGPQAAGRGLEPVTRKGTMAVSIVSNRHLEGGCGVKRQGPGRPHALSSVAL